MQFCFSVRKLATYYIYFSTTQIEIPENLEHSPSYASGRHHHRHERHSKLLRCMCDDLDTTAETVSKRIPISRTMLQLSRPTPHPQNTAQSASSHRTYRQVRSSSDSRNQFLWIKTCPGLCALGSSNLGPNWSKKDPRDFFSARFHLSW